MLSTTDLSVPVETRASDSGVTGLVPAGMVDELMARVRSEGIELLGEGGLIPELTKRLLERAMDEELTDHLATT